MVSGDERFKEKLLMYTDIKKFAELAVYPTKRTIVISMLVWIVISIVLTVLFIILIASANSEILTQIFFGDEEDRFNVLMGILTIQPVLWSIPGPFYLFLMYSAKKRIVWS